MDNKDKHNIFSKEEFFKSIDEKKSLPAGADDFDKEALEGLAMVTDRKKLDSLNDSLDEVLRLEAAKARKKKTIYFLSVAASLVLIVGLFFIMKENTLNKEADSLAINNPEKTESVKQVGESMATVTEEKAPAPPSDMISAAEVKSKEVLEDTKSQKDESGLDNTVASGAAISVPAEEVAENKVTLSMNEKANTKEVAADRLDANQEGKSGAKPGKGDVSFGNTEKLKKEEAQKRDEDVAYKKTLEEDEKKKKMYYETNTIWVSDKDAKESDKLKQKSLAKSEAKPSATSTGDNRNQPVNVVTTTNTAPVQTQDQEVTVSGKLMDDQSKVDDAPAKNAELQSTSQPVTKKVTQGPFSKKHRSKTRKIKASFGSEPKTDKKEPDAVEKERAGYASYEQSGTRDLKSPEFIGGKEALQEYVKGNLTISEPSKTGTIVSEFTIKPDGSVDTGSVKVTTPIKKCDPCNEDVKRMVKKMPKWQPARENGKSKEYRQKLSVDYDAEMMKK